MCEFEIEEVKSENIKHPTEDGRTRQHTHSIPFLSPSLSLSFFPSLIRSCLPSLSVDVAAASLLGTPPYRRASVCTTFSVHPIQPNPPFLIISFGAGHRNNPRVARYPRLPFGIRRSPVLRAVSAPRLLSTGAHREGKSENLRQQQQPNGKRKQNSERTNTQEKLPFYTHSHIRACLCVCLCGV